VRPYASVLMEEPAALAEHLTSLREQGFGPSRSVGSLRQEGRRDGSSHRRAARERGPGCRLMVDAGGATRSGRTAFLGPAHRRDARGARRDWFEEPCSRTHRGLRRASPRVPLPISGGEVLTRRSLSSPGWRGSPGHRAARRHQGRRISEARRIGWMAQEHGVRYIRTLEHRRGARGGSPARLGVRRTDLVEYIGDPVRGRARRGAMECWTETGCSRSRTKPGLASSSTPGPWRAAPGRALSLSCSPGDQSGHVSRNPARETGSGPRRRAQAGGRSRRSVRWCTPPRNPRRPR